VALWPSLITHDPQLSGRDITRHHATSYIKLRVSHVNPLRPCQERALDSLATHNPYAVAP